MNLRVLLRTMVAAGVMTLAGAANAQSNDSILSRHIKEADGTTGQDTNSGAGVKTGHLQDGAVNAAKIAAGAITDDKITAGISASKINRTGLDAE